MHINYFRIIAMLTGALALSGCLTTEEATGEALPPAGNELSAMYTGEAGETGIGSHLSSGGTWKVKLDGQVQSKTFGTVSLLNAMVYDSVADQWTININGANIDLTWENLDSYVPGVNGYVAADCLEPTPTSCTGFTSYVAPAPLTDQYGTFAVIGHGDDLGSLVFVHYGLKTSDMPTSGTAQYLGGDGSFVGGVISTADKVGDILVGPVKIDARFTSGSESLDFESTGAGIVAGSTYTLIGGAKISGNTYQGSLTTATYTGTAGDGTTKSVIIDTTGSSLSGAFYGPDAAETAGVVYAGGAGSEIGGGFWAAK